jgi:hypothetical protein
MKKPSKLYAAAVHEAGHAQVGLALGMKFAKHEAICCKRGTGLTVYELAILDGKSQPIAHVRPLRFTGHSPVSRAAFDLAGGIAKYRVTQGDPGIVSDAAQVLQVLSNQFDNLPAKTKQDDRWLAAYMREKFCPMLASIADVKQDIAEALATKARREIEDSSVEAAMFLLYGDRKEAGKDAADVEGVVTALCVSKDTADACKMLDPRVTAEPYFAFLANAANKARAILDERWDAVLALASHLLKVGQMSAAELTAFDKATPVQSATSHIPQPPAVAQIEGGR